MRRTGSLFLALALALPGGAEASGNHYGWCIGVGNKHRAANCGSGAATGGGTQTPATVPNSNQLPPAGQTTPGGTGPTTPTITTLTPLLPDVITGTSPVPQVQGQPGPTITGGQPPVVTIIPNPPTTFTGTSPVAQVQPQPTPSFTGGQPPPMTIFPNQPVTIVGYGQVPATTILVPTPYAVPQRVPQLVPGATPSATPQRIPGRVPQATPQAVPQPVPPRVPGATPTATPSATPQLIPGRVPQATPQPVPQAIPQPTLQAVPMLVPQIPPGQTGTRPNARPTMVMMPRPKPRPQTMPPIATVQGAKVVHRPQPQAPALGPDHITRTVGRQAPHDAPRFAGGDGQTWRCVASGHGKRRSVVDGEVSTAGALRHVGAVDVLGRDLPALHPRRSDCLISVRRRKD